MRRGTLLAGASVVTTGILLGVHADRARGAVMFDSQNRFVTRLAHNDPLVPGTPPPPSTSTILDAHAPDFGLFTAGNTLPPGGAGQTSGPLSGPIIAMQGFAYLPVNPIVGPSRIQWESDQSHFETAFTLDGPTPYVMTVAPAPISPLGINVPIKLVGPGGQTIIVVTDGTYTGSLVAGQWTLTADALEQNFNGPAAVASVYNATLQLPEPAGAAAPLALTTGLALRRRRRD
jgi:hypothetical protein